MSVDDAAAFPETVASRTGCNAVTPVRPAPEMSLMLASNDEDMVILVTGELDLSTAPRLGDALERALNDGRRVVVDLAGVTFMDSQGLNTLARIHQRCPQLRLRGAPPTVRSLLAVTGLDQVFSIES